LSEEKTIKNEVTSKKENSFFFDPKNSEFRPENKTYE
jgi:hypothetical protein